MDKRIKKFIIISALSIVAVYWAAWKLDSFGTVMVGLISSGLIPRSLLRKAYSL